MIQIQRVRRTMTNRRIFRTLARDNCGESMEPSENEAMYFAYQPMDYKMKGNVIACASVQFANPSVTDTTQDSYFHWLTFLFVHKEFQLYGYGRNILSIISVEIFNDCNRPLRVESARKAVNFFIKCDFKQICAEPKECAAGSGYFKFLFLMEKNCYSNKEEVWDD